VPTDSDAKSIASLSRRIPSSPLIQSRPASSAGDSPKPLSANPASNVSNQSLAPPPTQFSGFGREYGNNGQSRSTDRLPFYENASRSASTLSIKTLTTMSNQPQRTSKARLNLLNPMSLLARRRSSQALAQRDQNAGLNIQNLTIPAIPDDYDPRIRGHGIHDFSAPRPRRKYSANDAILSPFESTHPRLGFQDAERRRSDAEAIYEYEPKHTGHTPLFKEHFGDDTISLPTDSPRYSAFDLPPPDRDPPPLPPFARHLPAEVPSPTDLHNSAQEPPDVKPLPQPLAVVPEAESQSTSQSSSPPRASISDGSFHTTSVPKRLASNASRFSFDMGGVGSTAQERILEEKHKRKEAERRAANRESRGGDSDEEEFDYENIDEDDGFEERIPGVNVDLEDEEQLEEGIPGVNIDFEEEAPIEEEVPGENAGSPIEINEELPKQGVKNHEEGAGLEGFRFTPALPSTMSSPTSTIDTGRISQSTPRDESGNVIGFAVFKESPGSGRMSSPAAFPSLSTPLQNALGLVPLQPHNETIPTRQLFEDEDDLYFDDGNIAHPPLDTEAGGFDENVFDDETSNLYERRTRVVSSLQERTVSPNQVFSDVEGDVDDEEFSPVRVSSAVPQTFTKVGIPRGYWASNQSQPSITYALASEPSGLTEGNLAAYHDALALAATEAAANGRFARKPSISQGSETTSQMDDGVPGLISDDSRTSRGLDSLRPFSNDHLTNDFSFDDGDDLDDDAIIAAANADALENDDEGFYGQEFGFYARANGNCNSEMVNGGYFGSRGVEGVTRSHSGRVNFREPSLTPITERSEWSTRNSVISLPTLGIPHSAHTLPSPGLAQLVGMDEMDDDMSLSALMKLRRGAFGGSNGSLRSSATSQASASPLTHFPPANLGGPNLGAHSTATSGVSTHLAGSIYSPVSSTGLAPGTSGIREELDEEGSPASPTLTMDGTADAAADFGWRSPHAPDASPMRKGAIRGRGHSRGSSGAESVSYVKETDPDGSGRWILERRRTGESGEIEVIGREVLTGGRI
jgi:hypothetical protein